MECPSCHFENESTSTYCERCGTLLQDTTPEPFPEQVEYQVPPPPPMNGHNPLPTSARNSAPPTPPSPEEFTDDSPLVSEFTAPSAYEQSRMSSASSMEIPSYSNQKLQPPRRLSILSAILYFLGVILVTYSIFAILVNFGSGATIGLIGIMLSLGIVLVSIVLFVRLVQRHTPSLHWWQRLLWLVGMTVAAFLLLLITALVVPSKSLLNVLISCVFLLYGLAWCFTAIW